MRKKRVLSKACHSKLLVFTTQIVYWNWDCNIPRWQCGTLLLPFYFSRLSIHPFQSKTLLLLSEQFLLWRSCLKVTATFSSAVVALLVPQNWIAVVVISRHKDLPAASFNMKTTFLSSQGFQHLTIHMHQKNAWLFTAKSFQAFVYKIEQIDMISVTRYICKCLFPE